MNTTMPSYCGFRFPSEIISHTIWLYYGKAEEGDAPRFTTNALVDLAKLQPPRNTRSFGRSEIIRHVVKEGGLIF